MIGPLWACLVIRTRIMQGRRKKALKFYYVAREERMHHCQGPKSLKHGGKDGMAQISSLISLNKSQTRHAYASATIQKDVDCA